MVHVAIYADETYMNDSFMYMGGFLSSASAWLDVVNPWKVVLGKPPAVPYFSHHGFRSKEWCKEHGVPEREMPLLEDKKLQLARLIAEANVKFFAHSGMWRSHFDEEILSHVRALKNPQYELLRDPYYFCYVRFVSLLLGHIPKLNGVLPIEEQMTPLDVFVDENGKLGKKASELFLDIKEAARVADPARAALMGHAAPLDDKVTIPLQYADLRVGEMRDFYASNTITPAMRILKQRRFTSPFGDVGLDWTRDTLRAFAEGVHGLPESRWLL